MLHGTLTSKAAGHKRFSSWMEKHPLPQDTQPNSKPGAKAAGLTDIRYTLLSEAGYSLLQAKGLIQWINSYIPVIKRSNFPSHGRQATYISSPFRDVTYGSPVHQNHPHSHCLHRRPRTGGYTSRCHSGSPRGSKWAALKQQRKTS